MSESSPEIPTSLSASGYEDGLGRRSLEIDRESGAMLERLHLRPELGAFEAFLRERVAFTSSFDDERFARVKTIERDRRGVLTIISQFVAGIRLSELLEAATALPADEATCPSVDAALGFLLDVLPALGSLHELGAHAHGALTPERIVLTPASQVVILDWLYGPTIQRLGFNKRRLWTEFGIAAPAGAGPTNLDITADVSQASLAAMMIVLGRPLREEEYPDGIGTLVNEVIEIAQIRGSGDFASSLEAFFQRTLPLPSRTPHADAADAVKEVQHIAREIGVSRCRTALTAFLGDMTRVLAEERAQAERAAEDSEFVGLDETVEEMAAAMIPDLGTTYEDVGVETPFVSDSSSDLLTLPAFDEFDPNVRADAFEEPPASSTEDLLSAPETIEPLASTTEPFGTTDIEPEPIVPELPAITEFAAFDPHRYLSEPIEDPVIETSATLVPLEPPFVAPRVSEQRVANDPPRTTEAAETAHAAKEEVTPAPLVIPAPLPPAAAPPVPQAAAAPQVVLPPSVAPEPAAPPQVPQPPAPAPQQSKPSKRKKQRGSKGQRDKLQSNAAPPPPPKPAPPPPPPPVAIPMPTFNAVPDPFRQSAPAAAPAPPAPPMPAAQQPTPLRLKSDSPAAGGPPRLRVDAPSPFHAPPARNERRDAPVFGSTYMDREAAEGGTNFPWRLAAAAVVGIVALIGIGRAYIPGQREPAETTETAATPGPAAATEKTETGKAGALSITTQPVGAHVFLDGKAIGDSPITVQSVSPGKHTLTFVTASGTVKKPIRIEAGKPLAIEVPIYSGWIAVFSPVTLDIAENGKSIGTTEQGRLMLSPGKHQLTFTSREMGYKTTQAVDIEPGEERSISLVPTGDLSANATPWAEVWMNGNKVGDTPIGNLRVPLGTHEVVFKNPKFPDRQVTVTVTASGTAVAFVDFTK